MNPIPSALNFRYRWLAIVIVCFSINTFSLPASAQDPEPAAPPYQDLHSRSLGPGPFPDVAFYQGEVWIATYDMGSNQIVVYRASLDLSSLSVVKQIPLSSGTQPFPRIASTTSGVWVAYRDGEPNFEAKLWRSDTDTIESLGAAHGNNPVAINAQYVAWMSTSNFNISLRSLNGGSIQNVGQGTGQGLSRITSSRVALIDDDRTLYPWGFNFQFAPPLIVAEHLESGIAGRFNNDAATEFRLYPGESTNNPRAATDGQEHYAVAVWQPAPWNAVKITTFTSSISLDPSAFEEILGGSVAGFDCPGLGPIPITEMNFGQFIEFLFEFGLYLLGISVFVNVFWAATLWFTAAGNSGQVSKARSKIFNAIIGAILLISSYVILNTINPDLVNGRIDLPSFERGGSEGCVPGEGSQPYLGDRGDAGGQGRVYPPENPGSGQPGTNPGTGSGPGSGTGNGSGNGSNSCGSGQPGEINTEFNSFSWSNANYYKGDSGVGGWERTAQISSVNVPGPSEEPISFPWSSDPQWPEFSEPGVGGGLVGNVWIIAKIDGLWNVATWDWLRYPDQGSKGESVQAIACEQVNAGPFATWRPQNGDVIGIFVSTPARGEVRTLNHRSGIVWTEIGGGEVGRE